MGAIEHLKSLVHPLAVGAAGRSRLAAKLMVELGKMYAVTDDRLCSVMRGLSHAEVSRLHRKDPWLRNYYLNWWEYATGQTVLESYPWNVSLPFADVCNAKCTFCDSWLRGEGMLRPEHLDRFAEVLPHAVLLGIQGHGEPLANPHIDEILTRLSEILDRRCSAFVITNGVYLRDKLDLLLKSRVTTVTISLNAASRETHEKVMGIGKSFDDVVAAIERLIAIRGRLRRRVSVALSFVLTYDNISEAVAFIRLACRLGVDWAYIRTLAPNSGPIKGLNYHLLPPYRHPQFEMFCTEIRRAIRQSTVPIRAEPDNWAVPVMPEETLQQFEQRTPQVISRAQAIRDTRIKRRVSKEHDVQVRGLGMPTDHPVLESTINPYNRTPRFLCRFVYHNLLCHELNFRLVPCCYMTEVPGHEQVVCDGRHDFFTYWNSPAFVELRRRLNDGPLYGSCKTCPVQS
jgi:pyruvate-formate lyase-activating enzyme